MVAVGHTIQGNTNLCCTSVDSPEKPECGNPTSHYNLDPLPVTVYKYTKVATAKLITDEVVCSTCEREQPSTELDMLLHPLPHDITESQKEQFLALMSHYSCVIA